MSFSPFPRRRSQQGLRAKHAQLEIESDMQGRDKVLGEENIGHNLLKKMGELLFRCAWADVAGARAARMRFRVHSRHAQASKDLCLFVVFFGWSQSHSRLFV